MPAPVSSPASSSPPLDHFLARLGGERLWGEVRVRRAGRGFELRHAADGAAAEAILREVAVGDLRGLADLAADGRFRPLKSAPTLVRGWRCVAGDEGELAEALQALYPGSLADAWAWETGRDRGVDFADVAGRQAGRGRVLAGLTGPALAAVVAAGCGAAFCRDRRRWRAAGVEEDDGMGKGEVPCLEPCGVFLAFAQACARTEQAESVAVHFAPDDLATLAAALRHVLENPAAGWQDGGVDAPLHPRRVARLLVRHREVWERRAENAPEADAHE